MSAGAKIWQAAPGQNPPTVEGASAATQIAIDSDSAEMTPLASLARQVFFPGAGLKRNHVLFLAADEGTRILNFCEQAAAVLSGLTESNVAVVGARTSRDATSLKKPAQSVMPARFWHTHSLPVSDRLWRLPAWLFFDQEKREASDHRKVNAELHAIFEYFLFAATAQDSEVPLFCSLCEAAVLVVTANRTRRESALRAKDQLLRYKIPLLGTVLDQRVFEIPEAIHRRL